jgi:heptosyltransferase-1
MPEPKFLVVRLSSLGDIVHTFPAVSGLRETFPKAEIVWLTHPRWKLLVESSGLATEVWPVENRSLASLREVTRRIKRTKFSTALDYQGLWKSAALSFFGNVRRRIGFSSESIREYGVPILYTDRVRSTETHIADQNGELSQRAGARSGTAGVNLAVPLSAESTVREYLRAHGVEHYVALSPGGGWRSKCWPPDHFGVLCRKIRESLGISCIINCGPGEENLATEVRDASDDAGPLLYNGELGPLMALLRNAMCIVGGDTGPLHLAVALGTPAVALFGPTDPARNGPYRGGETRRNALPRDIVLRSPDAVTTYKRGDQPDPSMLEIEVDAVFDAVRRQVEARTWAP